MKKNLKIYFLKIIKWKGNRCYKRRKYNKRDWQNFMKNKFKEEEKKG
jgi:hypothetical protein